jgi:hypothetical protein
MAAGGAGLQCSYPFRRRGNETPYGSLRDGTVALLARGTTMQLHRTLSAPHAIRPGRRHIGICAALMLVGAGLGPARDGARRRRPRRARIDSDLARHHLFDSGRPESYAACTGVEMTDSAWQRQLIGER